MPIEFRCHQCQKLLRTPDDTAGKQAKCPTCGTVLPIPQASAAEPPPAPPGGAAGSPFGASAGQPPGGSPFGAPGAQPGADPQNPYQSPAATSFAPSGFTQAQQPGAITPTIIDFGDIFDRTWTIFKSQWGMALVGVILVGLMNFGASMVLNVAVVVVAEATGDPAIAQVVNLVCIVPVWAFQIWIGIGQAIFFLKIARGQEPLIGDLFSGGRFFWPILGATFLFAIMLYLGLLLCIVPGVIVGLMFGQYYYLIVDGKARVIESLDLSKQITTGNKATLFLIGLVAGLVGLAAVVLTCGLGMLVVVPYLTLMAPVIYLVMTGQPTADQVQMGHS